MNKWTAFSDAHLESFVGCPGGGMVQLFNPDRDPPWPKVYAEYRDTVTNKMKATDRDFRGATHWRPLSDPPEGA